MQVGPTETRFTILIKFLIKTNSATFKDRSSCLSEIFSSSLSFLSFGREETHPSLYHRYHPSCPRSSHKKDPSWWWTKVRRPFAWIFVPPTSTQQPPPPPILRLIIYPSRLWITPTVGRTQLINSPVAIHLTLPRPRIFHRLLHPSLLWNSANIIVLLSIDSFAPKGNWNKRFFGTMESSLKKYFLKLPTRRVNNSRSWQKFKLHNILCI